MPIIRANVSRESAVRTDAASWYQLLPFYTGIPDHETVNHTAGECVRVAVRTKTIEGYYSIFKRGMKGA
jgi:hypothetical protein